MRLSEELAQGDAFLSVTILRTAIICAFSKDCLPKLATFEDKSEEGMKGVEGARERPLHLVS